MPGCTPPRPQRGLSLTEATGNLTTGGGSSQAGLIENQDPAKAPSPASRLPVTFPYDSKHTDALVGGGQAAVGRGPREPRRRVSPTYRVRGRRTDGHPLHSGGIFAGSDIPIGPHRSPLGFSTAGRAVPGWGPGVFCGSMSLGLVGGVCGVFPGVKHPLPSS